MSKRSFFGTHLDNQCVNGSKALLKPTRQHFCSILAQFWDKLSWKTSLLVRTEMLGLFVNSLTADDKYFCHNRDNFQQPIPMELPKTLKTFSGILLWFLNCNLVEKKHEPHSGIISKIIAYEKCGYLIALKVLFRNTFW